MRDAFALVFALALPTIVVVVLWRLVRGPRTRFGLRAEPDRPRSFGYKTSWLAVRAEDPRVLIDALRATDSRFRDATPCNWESGFGRVFGALASGAVFVTPSIEGWVLAVGYVPDPHPGSTRNGDGAAALRALERLSTALEGPLHFFGSHRGVDYVDWVVIERGETKRAYAHADGKTYYDVGAPTPEERALDLVLRDAIGASEDDERYEKLPSEGTVIALATKWTIDPLELEAIETPSTGTLVRLG